MKNDTLILENQLAAVDLKTNTGPVHNKHGGLGTTFWIRILVLFAQMQILLLMLHLVKNFI